MTVTFRVPKAALRSHRDDVILLLRLGAGINAMDALARALVRAGTARTLAASVDRQQLFIAALAYLGEFVKRISESNYLDRFCALVQAGVAFTAVPVGIDDVRLLLSPAANGAGEYEGLLKVRDKVAFHWNRRPFADTFDDPRSDVVDFWTIDGTPPERTFASSAYAIAELVMGVPIEDLVTRLENAIGILGHAVEAACSGLAAEAGEDPRRCFV